MKQFQTGVGVRGHPDKISNSQVNYVRRKSPVLILNLYRGPKF